jgi:Lrp/AsnC family leucine-responsive transcriptional regulator
LDDYDRKILNILQKNNATPQREIAERVHLSAPAVQRRIKRLEAEGVIRAQVALLAPEKAGLPMITVITEVLLSDERLDVLNALKTQFSATPQVQQCYYVTGEADFVLVMMVADMAEYEALTHRLFFANPNVQKFKTLIAMDRVKVGLEVPL